MLVNLTLQPGNEGPSACALGCYDSSLQHNLKRLIKNILAKYLSTPGVEMVSHAKHEQKINTIGRNFQLVSP